MPRRAPYFVRWLSDKESYSIDGAAALPALTPGCGAWFDWLDSIASFAFHSRSGAFCTARKERLRRGGAYWYGYRSRDGRTVKRYLGRTTDLTIERLEEIAEVIARITPRAELTAPQTGEATSAALVIVTPVPSAPMFAPTMMPLLASKLHPPRLPGALVARTRLLDQLDAALSLRLTLVSAPAGFGKTTLIRQWTAERVALTEVPWPGSRWTPETTTQRDSGATSSSPARLSIPT